MKRFGFLMCTVAALAMGLTTAAHSGRKKSRKKAAAAPAELTFNNTCKEALDLTIGGKTVAVAAGATSEPVVVQAKADEPVMELKAKEALLARLAIIGEQKYTVKITDCLKGMANVSTHWTTAEKPASPHAMAQVRFRARARKYFEVKEGAKGRFHPVSVAVTKYHEAQPGEFPYNVRMRMARKGPIVANVQQAASLEAGRKYLIEVDAVGRDLFFTVEDEGKAE